MNNAVQIAEQWPGWDGASAFEELLDVRSPDEFAEDHAPGAVNLPVLQNDERATVGALYVQTGAFPARRLGAGLVSANIARHFASHFAEKSRDYRPLVYCWRGGQRSASLATVLAAVGWRVTVLRGGYKTYRAHVRDRLETRPGEYKYRLIGGATGSAKTQLLHRLAAHGAQSLDLEGLANHRGSALGHLGPQPTQKMFESRVLAALEKLDPTFPVWMEAESNRIGALYIPAQLWAAMKVAGGIELKMPVGGRVAHLLSEYEHYVSDPSELIRTLRQFATAHGGPQLREWESQITAGHWVGFVASLLAIHYDPRYAASAGRCFPNITQPVALDDASDRELDRVASELQEA